MIKSKLGHVETPVSLSTDPARAQLQFSLIDRSDGPIRSCEAVHRLLLSYIRH